MIRYGMAIMPILFAMMCNTTQYDSIEHSKPLFEQTNLCECLKNDQDDKIYLKYVALYAPVNSSAFLCGSEMEENKFRKLNPEFTLYWKYRGEGSWIVEEHSAVAHFVKDMETGYYKIYQTSLLDGWWEMEKIPRIDKNSPSTRIPKPISFEPARGEYRYAGRSDNEQLLSVKVWKYVQKERDGRRGAKTAGANVRRKTKRKR